MQKANSAKLYNFRTIIQPDTPSGYHGFVPLLPGLHTFGSSIAVTKRNLKEAIVCHIQGLLKDGESIPRDSDAVEYIQELSSRDLLMHL